MNASSTVNFENIAKKNLEILTLEALFIAEIIHSLNIKDEFKSRTLQSSI